MEAHNKLGRIESGHLSKDADSFGKLNLFVSFAVIFMACSDLPEVQSYIYLLFVFIFVLYIYFC